MENSEELSESDTDRRLVLLSLHDNVLVACAPIGMGETVRIGGTDICTASHVGLGHKVARTQITKGSRVIKHGFPIGTATEFIPPGSHVHTHNLKSSYTPTYTIDSSNGVQVNET